MIYFIAINHLQMLELVTIMSSQINRANRCSDLRTSTCFYGVVVMASNPIN